ncbi:MAG: cob(I)yrinic acid a,c-diamide adenosyltransferase [bacterium]
MTGYVQVYTGDGKGKTTAAFGLALRAVGAGLRVYIAQFVKGMHYSELDVVDRFEGALVVEQFGRDCFIRREPEPEDIAAARQGYDRALEVLRAGDYDVVVLDEANIATHFNLFTVDDLLALIDARPDHVELVITGRRADPRILDRADLVTDMREIKHYYQQGVEARRGFET